MQIGLKGITKILQKKAPETLIGVISCGLVTTSVYEIIKAGINSYNQSKDKKERVVIDTKLEEDLLKEKEVSRKLRDELKLERKERLIKEHENSDLKNEIKSIREDSQVASSGLEVKLESDQTDLPPSPINFFGKWVKDQKSSLPDEYISIPKKIVLPVKPAVESKLGLDELMCLSLYDESNAITIKLITLLLGWYASFYPLVNYKLKMLFFGKKW